MVIGFFLKTGSNLSPTCFYLFCFALYDGPNSVPPLIGFFFKKTLQMAQRHERMNGKSASFLHHFHIFIFRLDIPAPSWDFCLALDPVWGSRSDQKRFFAVQGARNLNKRSNFEAFG